MPRCDGSFLPMAMTSHPRTEVCAPDHPEKFADPLLPGAALFMTAYCLQIGPRLELQIVKIQEGLASGRVLFHRFDQRSAEDKAAQQQDAEAKERLRAERRQEQEENVRRKAAEARREQLAKEVSPSFTAMWPSNLCCTIVSGCKVGMTLNTALQVNVAAMLVINVHAVRGFLRKKMRCKQQS